MAAGDERSSLLLLAPVNYVSVCVARLTALPRFFRIVVDAVLVLAVVDGSSS